MGFIKSIFGLIGGIFKAILGVFGVGKKSEFYMEIDEESAAAAPATEAPTPAAPAKAPAPVAVAAPAPTPVAAPPAPKPTQPADPVPSFAANYLTGSSMPSRRRPGPSLSPFKTMAKQVKAR